LAQERAWAALLVPAVQWASPEVVALSAVAREVEVGLEAPGLVAWAQRI
jgi:hypothetical protein